jgi:polar amino acid transport system substrate-binding protein
MATIALLLAAVLAASIGGCATAPGTTMSAPTSATKTELAPTGTLRVAVFTGNPVIGSKDRASGELKGTTVILGRELAARAGVPVGLIEYTAVGKMVEDARAGAWDIAVVAFDPARRSVLEFAPPHMVVDLTYLVAPGSSIRSVADADKSGVRIGAARGAATALFLQRELKAAIVVPAENEPAVFALLREGKVDAIAQNRFLLLGLAEQLPGPRVLEDRFSAAEMTIVLPKGRAAALEYVGNFVEEAKRSGSVGRAIEAAGLRGVRVARSGG